MEDKDAHMFYAAMALVGLVLRGESPKDAAQMAQKYADAMLEEKKCSQE